MAPGSANGRRGRTLGGVGLLLGLALMVAACTPTAPESDGPPPTGPRATGPSDGTATSAPADSGEPGATGQDQAALPIAVVGDSITVGSNPTFAPGEVSEDSWVSSAVGDSIELTGGWARWGATTAEMAEAAGPVPAEVLVIMAGTNDLAMQVPTAEVAANLERIVAAVGAQQVLLCGVPPLDHAPEAVPPFNEFLEQVADQHGWAWVDASRDVRSGNEYAPGMSTDGVHPTRAAAELLGAQVRAVLLAEFG